MSRTSAHYYSEGTNVSPGLWSSAEVEVLVISGNLPLMKPLFLRLAALLKSYQGHYRISGDEGSSETIELSRSKNKSKNKDKPGEATNVDSSDYWKLSRSVVAQGATRPSGTGGLRDGLPCDRILVEMDLEQNVHSLEAITPVRPRES